MNPAHTKQYILFKQALIERYGSVQESKIRIDHKIGTCEYDGIKYGILFPSDYIEYTERKFEKTIDYCFIGNGRNREWVKDYDGCIDFTKRGRHMDTKYDIDKPYYDAMMQSRFALCPAGAFEWTYRAYEALMCCAIPVFLSEPTFHDYNKKYYYQLHGQPHSYSIYHALKNRELFLQEHTI